MDPLDLNASNDRPKLCPGAFFGDLNGWRWLMSMGKPWENPNKPHGIYKMDVFLGLSIWKAPKSVEISMS